MTDPAPSEAHTLTGAYVCDALGPGERSAMEEHLRVCEPCTQEVAEFSAVAAVLGAALAVRPPRSLREAVRARIASTRQEREPPAPLRRLIARLPRGLQSFRTPVPNQLHDEHDGHFAGG